MDCTIDREELMLTSVKHAIRVLCKDPGFTT